MRLYCLMLWEWSEETLAKSCEQSSINKSDKQSRHTIRTCTCSKSFTFMAEVTEWLGLLIIPICSIWPGHEKSHVPGCWLKIPQRCQSTSPVVFIPTIDTVEVLLDKMATLTMPSSWHDPSPAPKSRGSLQRMLRKLGAAAREPILGSGRS